MRDIRCDDNDYLNGLQRGGYKKTETIHISHMKKLWTDCHGHNIYTQQYNIIYVYTFNGLFEDNVIFNEL